MLANPWDQLYKLSEKRRAPRGQPLRGTRPGSETGMLLALIRETPGQTTTQLVARTGIRSPRIWGMLKRYLARGDVKHIDGKWKT